MKRPSTRALWGLALAVTLTLTWGERATACSCIGFRPELVTLEIESVTVDGAPVASLAPWQQHDVTLRPDNNGDVLMLRWTERGDDQATEQSTGLETYEQTP